MGEPPIFSLALSLYRSKNVLLLLFCNAIDIKGLLTAFSEQKINRCL